MTTKEQIIYIRYAAGVAILLVLLVGITFILEKNKPGAEEIPAALEGVISAIGDDGVKLSIRIFPRGWGREKIVIGRITSDTGLYRQETRSGKNSVVPVSDTISIPFTELRVGQVVLIVPVRESISTNASDFDLLVLTVLPQ